MKLRNTFGLVFILVLLCAAAAGGRVPRRQAYSVRIEGYIGRAPAEVPAEVVWTVSLGGRSYDLHVSRLQVLTGNIAYYDIIRALRPYRPAFTLAGPDDQLGLLAGAPAGQKVGVVGVLRFGGGARHLLVNRVELVGEPTPVAPPTPSPSLD